MGKKFFCLVGIITCALFGFMITDAPAFSGKPVKIAHILPLTGPVAPYGENAEKGFKLAIHELNSKGGIKGREVIGTSMDGRGDKTQSASLVRKVAEDKEYIAITGLLRSPVAIACSPIAGDLGIINISTGSVAIWPGDFNPWTFRTTMPATIALPILVKAVHQKLNVKKAAIMFAYDDDYTVSEMKIDRDICKELGIQLTDVLSFRTGDTDFKAQLTKVKANEPDILLLAALTVESGLIMSQAREIGIKARFVGGAGLGDPTYYKLSGGAGEGALFAAAFNPRSDRKVVKDFVAAYRKYYKTEDDPHLYVAWAWDAIMVLAKAIEKAPSYTRKAVRDELGKTKDFEGVTGVFSYNNCGDAIKKEATIMEMKGGKYVVWQ